MALVMCQSTLARNVSFTLPPRFAVQSGVGIRRITMSPFKDELAQEFDKGYEQGYEDARLEWRNEFETCRNELCLRCGSYKMAHKGACDGCRWKH